MARDPSSSTRPPHLTTTPEFLQPWASAQMASGRSGKNRAVPSPGSPGNYPLLTLCYVTTSVLQCYLRKARCKEKKKKTTKQKKSHWGTRREDKCSEAPASNFKTSALPFAKSNLT